MKLGIVKEIRPDERRVAASPAVVARLVKSGWEVLVERGAGAGASFPDELYEASGARIVYPEEAWAADVVAKVRPPEMFATGAESDKMREGATLISFLFPGQNPDLVERIAAKKINVIAVDCIPRISRAQKVDALSSMANIAGYRAVVEAPTGSAASSPASSPPPARCRPPRCW